MKKSCAWVCGCVYNGEDESTQILLSSDAGKYEGDMI